MGWWKKLWGVSEGSDNALVAAVKEAAAAEAEAELHPPPRRSLWETTPPPTDEELAEVLRATRQDVRNALLRGLDVQEAKSAERVADVFADISMVGRHRLKAPGPMRASADYCAGLLKALTSRRDAHDRIRKIIEAIDKEERDRKEHTS